MPRQHCCCGICKCYIEWILRVIFTTKPNAIRFGLCALGSLVKLGHWCLENFEKTSSETLFCRQVRLFFPSLQQGISFKFCLGREKSFFKRMFHSTNEQTYFVPLVSGLCVWSKITFLQVERTKIESLVFKKSRFYYTVCMKFPLYIGI